MDYKIVAKAVSLRLGKLTGLVLREPELRLVLSVYADDVLLVIQDPGDLAQVETCQAIYSAASSARVNWVKSFGLAGTVHPQENGYGAAPVHYCMQELQFWAYWAGIGLTPGILVEADFWRLLQPCHSSCDIDPAPETDLWPQGLRL
ncbi:unnamed protein product [Caretta caretta]